MPVPAQRDPDLTRDVLARWLTERAPGARIRTLRVPPATGFSGETLLFDAEWDGRRESLVARVAPIQYQIFPEPRFAEQYRLLRLLDEHTDIPVPPVRWYEPSPEPLGAPFIVMDHVDGDVPTDMPPYHQDGWVTTIDPGERAAMWWSSLEILARIHRLAGPDRLDRPDGTDWTDLRFLDQPGYGRTGLDQRLGYYAHFQDWAFPGAQPTAAAALAWLRAHRPREPDPPVLLWGDARIGNMIFQAGVPRAVLDWEAAVLGQPEEDLAWFLYLDRHHSEGIGVPRLPGFPPAAETITRYEELLGRPLRDMDYYEVLSGYKFAVVMARIGQAFIDFGLIPADHDFPYNNTATQLLAAILDLPAPGPPPEDPFGG